MKSLGERERCFKVLKMENDWWKRLSSPKTLIMELKGKMLGFLSWVKTRRASGDG